MPRPQLSPLQSTITIAFASAITGYGAWKYAGPYRWLAELQLKFFSAYEVKVTLLFSFLLAFAAIGLFLLPFSAIQTNIEGPNADQSLSKWRHWEGSLQHFFSSGSGRMIGLGIVLTGVGGYQFFTALNIGSLHDVDVAKLESGATNAPEGRWWQASGMLLTEEAQGWKDKHTMSYYIPLVSERWSDGAPVKLVVLAKGKAAEKINNAVGTFSGLIDTSGIPGQVLEHWQSARAPVSTDTFLLELGDSPDKRMEFGKWFLGVGAGMLVLASLWQGILNRKNSR